MKTLSLILLVCLVFSATAFKQHFMKEHQTIRESHLATSLDHLHKMIGVEGGLQPCNAIGFLQCIQNNLNPDDNEYLADQILDLVEQIKSIQENNGDDPQALQQAVIGQLTQLTQDPDTGSFWICAFGSIAPTAPACQGQTAFFRKSSIFLQFPFTSKLHTKNVKNVHQRRVHQAINRMHAMIHKDFDLDAQRDALKCYIISVLDAVQALDPQDDYDLIKQFVYLSKIKQEAEQDLEDPQEKAKLIISLICDQTTGEFWKTLLSGVVGCSGQQQQIDFSQIPCQ